MEFMLLSVFIYHYNRLLTIEFIVNELNELNNSYYSAQNIYVLIKRLRGKLEEEPSNPKILINLRPGYILLINR